MSRRISPLREESQSRAGVFRSLVPGICKALAQPIYPRDKAPLCLAANGTTKSEREKKRMAKTPNYDFERKGRRQKGLKKAAAARSKGRGPGKVEPADEAASESGKDYRRTS